MLKKIKLKNSTILLIGLILITLGVFFGIYEFIIEKKDKLFSNMNIELLDNEMPKSIEKKDESNKNENSKDSRKIQEEPKEIQYSYIGFLEIPKLNLKRGFVDINSRYNNVDYNITIIKGSTMPGEVNNNLILAAHSGPCSYCYFDKLYKLREGDKAYLYYNNIKYYYKIVNIYEVEKDGTVPIYRDYNKEILTLITCTRNSNTKQTVYILEKINQENY